MSYTPLEFDRYYHVYNRGLNRENLFPKRRNYPHFLRLYRKYIFPVAETYAYCLLPNHFHLFIRVRSEAEQIELQIDRSRQRHGDRLDVSDRSIYLTPPSEAFNHMFIAYSKGVNKVTPNVKTTDRQS